MAYTRELDIEGVVEREDLPSTTSFSRAPTPERELERLFSTYRATLRRLEMDALRGGPPIDVSGYKNDFDNVDFHATLADKLSDQIIARQHDAGIVERNVRKAERALREARRDLGYSSAYINKAAKFDIPRTVFGTDAWIARRYFPKTSARGYAPKFLTRAIALPCVERQVRREVMFAKRKAGRGYKVKHRRHAFTDIWC